MPTDNTTASITINAAPDAVMAVIADVANTPSWQKNLKSCEVVETFEDGKAKRVQMVADVGITKDTYTVEYTWADNTVSWTIVEAGSVQSAQDGSYTLVPKGDGTEVTFSLEVTHNLPAPSFIRNKIQKDIAEKALKGLKGAVEA